MRPSANARQDSGLTIWQIVFSVAAAFFGVQSARRRQRDFQQGNPLWFMLVGLAMTVAVALVFAMAVEWVMAYYAVA